jgi:hypothetical protein
MEQNPSWEAQAVKKFPVFYEGESSLPCLYGPATISCTKPDKPSQRLSRPITLDYILILSSHLMYLSQQAVADNQQGVRLERLVKILIINNSMWGDLTQQNNFHVAFQLLFQNFQVSFN